MKQRSSLRTGTETLRQAGLRDGDALSAVAGPFHVAVVQDGSLDVQCAGNALESGPSARFMSAFVSKLNECAPMRLLKRRSVFSSLPRS